MAEAEAVVGRSVVAGRGEPGARVAWIGQESQNGVTAPGYSGMRRAEASWAGLL